MGWSSGTEVMETIISFACKHITDEAARMSFYMDMIAALEDQDWDCETECLKKDPAYDAALEEMYPGWFK